MDNRETICRKFLANPNINPQNGKRLVKNKGPYNKFVNICRELGYDKEVDALETIKSPKVSKSVRASRSPTKTIVVSSKERSPSPTRSPKSPTKTIIVSKERSPSPTRSTKRISLIKQKLGEGLGLTGLPEIDKEIMQHLSLDDLLILMDTNKTLEKEISDFILENVYIGNPNYQFYRLHLFVVDLIKTNRLVLAKHIISTDKTIDHDFYQTLGLGILGRRKTLDPGNLRNYFALAPMNLDWKPILSDLGVKTHRPKGPDGRT